MVGAAVVLLAQLVGAAHYHSDWSGGAQLIAGSASCPICELATHAPANPAAFAPQACPFVSHERIVKTGDYAHYSAPLPQVKTRAPPRPA